MKKQTKTATSRKKSSNDQKSYSEKTPVRVKSVQVRIHDVNTAFGNIEIAHEIPAIRYWAPGADPLNDPEIGFFFPTNKGLGFREAKDIVEKPFEVLNCDQEKVREILRKGGRNYKRSFKLALRDATSSVFRTTFSSFVSEKREDRAILNDNLAFEVIADADTWAVMMEFYKVIKIWANYQMYEIRDLLADDKFIEERRKKKIEEMVKRMEKQL